MAIENFIKFSLEYILISIEIWWTLLIQISGKSDHLAVVAAYNEWLKAKSFGIRAEREYLDRYFLNQQVLQSIQSCREEYVEVLSDLGFVSKQFKQVSN